MLINTQNISLQMVDEVGKAFDWHQISDFNCHQISVLSWYKFFFPVGLSHLILATPASCSPPHIILAKVSFKLWLILDSKKHFFLDPNVTRLLSHSLALLTSYPIIMISNMVNFQVLILFSISSVTKFVFEIEFLISQVLIVFAAVSAVPSKDFKVNCCSD